MERILEGNDGCRKKSKKGEGWKLGGDSKYVNTLVGWGRGGAARAPLFGPEWVEFWAWGGHGKFFTKSRRTTRTEKDIFLICNPKPLNPI